MSDATNKVTLNYQLRSFWNIDTKKPYMRGVPVPNGVMDLEAIAAMMAEDGGYLRGKQDYIAGELRSFCAAIKKVIREGKTVVLGDLLRLRGGFDGLDPETGRPTRDTVYRVQATPLKGAQFKVSDAFTLVKADTDVALPVFTNVTTCTLGARKDVVVKGQAVRIYGRNLFYSAEQGDTLTLSYKTDGEVQMTEVTPAEVEGGALKLAFPQALAEVADGTELTFTLATHRGDADGSVVTASRKATLQAK